MKHPLETRECVCGCERTFRCLPDSPNWFFSESHAKKALASLVPGVRRMAAEFFDEQLKRAAGRKSSGKRVERRLFNANGDCFEVAR